MNLRILICDDEQPMVALLERYLEPITSYVDSASSLHECMEKARTGNFNVIVLDLRLNGTGKTEALASIRTLKSYNSAVIVVSGLVQPDLREEVLAAGADAYIPKDNNLNSRTMLLAAHVAALHLPKETFKSSSFLEHVNLLHQLVQLA